MGNLTLGARCAMERLLHLQESHTSPPLDHDESGKLRMKLAGMLTDITADVCPSWDTTYPLLLGRNWIARNETGRKI